MKQDAEAGGGIRGGRGVEGPSQMILVISWKDFGSAAKQKGETDETLKSRWCNAARLSLLSSTASHRLDRVPPSGEYHSETLQARRKKKAFFNHIFAMTHNTKHELSLPMIIHF